MCGRFTLKTPAAEWAQLLLPMRVPAPPEEISPRYNIAPTQSVVSVEHTSEGLAFAQPRWGLVPYWADKLALGARMINARRETLQEKRSFAKLLDDRRLLILADGYFEWHATSAGKQPYWIRPAAGGLILLAGLWDSNRRATTGDPVRSCTMVTTAANDSLSEIHDRMPVPILPQDAEKWLDPDVAAQDAYAMLGTAADDFFVAKQVSTFVNSPQNDSPNCLEEIAPGELF